MSLAENPVVYKLERVSLTSNLGTLGTVRASRAASLKRQFAHKRLRLWWLPQRAFVAVHRKLELGR